MDVRFIRNAMSVSSAVTFAYCVCVCVCVCLCVCMCVCEGVCVCDHLLQVCAWTLCMDTVQ